MTETVKGLLTIGIPTYNGSANFEELFSSIKNLGLSDDQYEILVIDNASTDNSIHLLQGFKNQYHNLRFIQNKKNVGRIENWNEVLKRCAGEYLILMNVNDRFVTFDAANSLRLMDSNHEISMVLADLMYVLPDSKNIYPKWLESGLISFKDYITKTFLDTENMEYHSIGTLHQHIFRTSVIRGNNLQFDPSISRTTDRVFAGQVAKFGGGKFYYVNKLMVKWQLNKSRYHNDVHLTYKNFDLDVLWMNEYKANLQLANLAEIPLEKFLESQAIWARYYMYKHSMSQLADKFNIRLPTSGLEEITAGIYYNYIKAIAKFNNVSLSYNLVTIKALKKAIKLPLRKYGIIPRHPRSIASIIRS